jgi:hypothetical protein
MRPCGVRPCLERQLTSLAEKPRLPSVRAVSQNELAKAALFDRTQGAFHCRVQLKGRPNWDVPTVMAHFLTCPRAFQCLGRLLERDSTDTFFIVLCAP